MMQKAWDPFILPSKASRENKVAAMVILHGSGGEWSGREVDQAEFLVQHGIGAFIADPLVSRGLTLEVHAFLICCIYNMLG